MAEDEVVSQVQTTTTHIHGRTLNSAGRHHFIIDGPGKPNEEIVSMDAFLAGLSSCATHLMEDFAEEDGIELRRATVNVTAVRNRATLNRFEHIDLRLVLEGPSPEQANHLVERFKGR
jgi:uncharacterized OsmC-like protein